MRKLWSYSHFKDLATIPVPMTESSAGTSAVPVTDPSIGDRDWYR